MNTETDKKHIQRGGDAVCTQVDPTKKDYLTMNTGIGMCIACCLCACLMSSVLGAGGGGGWWLYNKNCKKVIEKLTP